MNEIIQFCQPIFQPLVLVFTILNLLSMGLQVNLGNMFKVVRNPKFLGLVLVLGWVVGPVIALSDHTCYSPWIIVHNSIVHRKSCTMCTISPSASPQSKGRLVFAGAFIPVAAIGTSLLMPILAPMLVKGIDLSVMSLLKPLFMSVLLPLLIGA